MCSVPGVGTAPRERPRCAGPLSVLGPPVIVVRSCGWSSRRNGVDTCTTGASSCVLAGPRGRVVRRAPRRSGRPGRQSLLAETGLSRYGRSPDDLAATMEQGRPGWPGVEHDRGDDAQRCRRCTALGRSAGPRCPRSAHSAPRRRSSRSGRGPTCPAARGLSQAVAAWHGPLGGPATPRARPARGAGAVTGSTRELRFSGRAEGTRTAIDDREKLMGIISGLLKGALLRKLIERLLGGRGRP